MDLLEADDSEKRVELRLGKDGQPYPEGASWHAVGSADDADALMAAAASRRVTKDNGLNERSSRSHLVLTLQVPSLVCNAPACAHLPLLPLLPSHHPS